MLSVAPLVHPYHPIEAYYDIVKFIKEYAYYSVLKK